MKNLYDIYEDGAITSTPGNTVGMGNPMLPTVEEPGTEPLITAKCKKDKKKCKKLKEGLLDNIDDTIDNLDNNDVAVLNFIEYLIANKNSKYINWDDDELKKFYLQKISSDKKGTIIIDYTNKDYWEASALSYIPITKNIPVNNIKFINCGNDTINVKPVIADISKFNIEIYNKDKKTRSGKLTISCEDLNFESIKLCKFKCKTFKIFSPSIKQLEINKNTTSSDCNTFGLEFCPKLEEIKGSILNITNILLPFNYMKKILCKIGIISNSSKLSITKGLTEIGDI
jgi:hypothetical protein